MDYYRLTAVTEDLMQACRQVAGKLETPQQEQIMTIGDALVAKGMEQGLQQGMQQGMEQGRQAGREEFAQTVATNMLHEGIDPVSVRRMTGLSVSDMQQLLHQAAI